jgi:hypothetical protein
VREISASSSASLLLSSLELSDTTVHEPEIMCVRQDMTPDLAKSITQRTHNTGMGVVGIWIQVRWRFGALY